MRSEEEANRALEKYADMIRRICMVNLKSYAATEDIFQTVFIKYVLSPKVFENEEHEKAWFIRVTTNCCKDYFRSLRLRRTEPLDVLRDYEASLSDEASEVLSAVLSLPQKYREPVYLCYYEGYTAPEAAELLGKNANTVYTLLARAKKLLRKELAGEEDEKSDTLSV